MFKIGNSKELPTIPDHLSNEGKDFVRKCLQRNPQDRPSAHELLDHPFVKCAAPLERPIMGPEASDPVSNIAHGTKSPVLILSNCCLCSIFPYSNDKMSSCLSFFYCAPCICIKFLLPFVPTDDRINQNCLLCGLKTHFTLFYSSFIVIDTDSWHVRSVRDLNVGIKPNISFPFPPLQSH